MLLTFPSRFSYILTLPLHNLAQASCRRNVSLDVVLSDAFGQPVDMENEVYSPPWFNTSQVKALYLKGSWYF